MFERDGAPSTTLKLDVGVPIDIGLSAPPAFMEDLGVVEHETSYRPILRRMAAYVIMTEGPVFDDVVVRRLARFHDFKKAGSQIRATVLDVIERRFPKPKEGERTLYWPEGSDRTISVCRLSGTEARDHSDIPEMELTALARSHLMAGATPAEAAVLMARDSGLGQLRSATRERFEMIAQACAA